MHECNLYIHTIVLLLQAQSTIVSGPAAAAVAGFGDTSALALPEALKTEVMQTRIQTRDSEEDEVVKKASCGEYHAKGQGAKGHGQCAGRAMASTVPSGEEPGAMGVDTEALAVTEALAEALVVASLPVPVTATAVCEEGSRRCMGKLQGHCHQGSKQRWTKGIVATSAAAARKHCKTRDAKCPFRRGTSQKGAESTNKCKRATAVGEIKRITRILPDEMETQPADINESWFASLMEPVLHPAALEPLPNPLDTATTLEFPGVALQQPDRLQTAPTVFYADVETAAQATLAPESSAAVMALDGFPDLDEQTLLYPVALADDVQPLAVTAAVSTASCVAAASEAHDYGWCVFLKLRVQSCRAL